MLRVEAQQADPHAPRQRLARCVAREEPHAELAPAVLDPEKAQVQPPDALRIDALGQIGQRLELQRVVLEQHQGRPRRDETPP